MFPTTQEERMRLDQLEEAHRRQQIFQNPNFGDPRSLVERSSTGLMLPRPFFNPAVLGGQAFSNPAGWEDDQSQFSRQALAMSMNEAGGRGQPGGSSTSDLLHSELLDPLGYGRSNSLRRDMSDPAQLLRSSGRAGLPETIVPGSTSSRSAVSGIGMGQGGGGLGGSGQSQHHHYDQINRNFEAMRTSLDLTAAPANDLSPFRRGGGSNGGGVAGGVAGGGIPDYGSPDQLLNMETMRSYMAGAMASRELETAAAAAAAAVRREHMDLGDPMHSDMSQSARREVLESMLQELPEALQHRESSDRSRDIIERPRDLQDRHRDMREMQDRSRDSHDRTREMFDRQQQRDMLELQRDMLERHMDRREGPREMFERQRQLLDHRPLDISAAAEQMTSPRLPIQSPPPPQPVPAATEHRQQGTELDGLDRRLHVAEVGRYNHVEHFHPQTSPDGNVVLNHPAVSGAKQDLESRLVEDHGSRSSVITSIGHVRNNQAMMRIGDEAQGAVDESASIHTQLQSRHPSESVDFRSPEPAEHYHASESADFPDSSRLSSVHNESAEERLQTGLPESADERLQTGLPESAHAEQTAGIRPTEYSSGLEQSSGASSVSELKTETFLDRVKESSNADEESENLDAGQIRDAGESDCKGEEEDEKSKSESDNVDDHDKGQDDEEDLKEEKEEVVTKKQESDEENEEKEEDEDEAAEMEEMPVKEEAVDIDPTQFLEENNEELSKWAEFNSELEKFKDQAIKAEIQHYEEIKSEPDIFDQDMYDDDDYKPNRSLFNTKKRGRKAKKERPSKHSGPAFCTLCLKTFKSEVSLKVHQSRIHTERTPHPCNFCDKIFLDKVKLLEHKYRMHTEAVEAEQGAPLPRYPCKQCPDGSKVFMVSRDLSKHVHIRHSGNYVKKPEPTENSHFCSLCGKGYKKAWPLVLHMRRHNNEKPFQCDQCAKAYALKGDLKRHYEINHMPQGEQTHVCKTCGKTFNNVHHLKVHERNHRKQKGKSFQCPECKDVFKENSALKEHMYYHGEPQFQCRECFEQFRTPELIREHLCMVHGQSPFSCEICCQECNSRDEKRNHVIRFHQERSYPCEICGKEFTNQTLLKIHTKRHMGLRNYACKECDKKYSSQVALNAHVNTIHKGEKKFTCDICHKSFGRYNNLTTHKVIHSGIKPFQCIYCSSGYGEKRNLMNHIQRNHPGQPLEFRRDPSTANKSSLAVGVGV